MRLSVDDRLLRSRLTSDTAMRASWGTVTDQVQMCLALLDAATELGDLLAFACLSTRVVPEQGVLVTHRDATIVLTPVDRGGHQIKIDKTWPTGLPPELQEVERALILGVQVELGVGSTSGRLR